MSGTSQSHTRAILRFAVPVSAQMVLQQAFGLLSQLFVATLGDTAIAATGLAAQLSGIALIALTALGIGGAIKLSRLAGATNQEGFARCAAQLLWLALFAGVLASVAMAVGAPFFVRAMGAGAQVRAAGIPFVRLIAWSMPLVGLIEVGGHVLRAQGDSRSPMFVGLASLAVDCGLSYLLIGGHCGFPRLGILGAGVAMIAARLLAVGLLGWLLFAARRPPVLSLRHMGSLDPARLHELVALAGPVAIGHGAWVLGMSAYTAVYSWLGTRTLAAIQVIQQIEVLWIMFSVGLGAACLTLLGQELGRKDTEKALSLAREILRLVFTLSVLTAVLMALGALLLGRLYPKLHPETLALARTGLLLAAALQPIKILNMVLATGILRTGGDVRFVTLCEGFTAVGIACAFGLGFELKLGLLGAMAGKAIEEGLKLAVFFSRYHSRRWLHTV